jgi:5-methylcytosine-specific restriction endonuclease McrA
MNEDKTELTEQNAITILNLSENVNKPLTDEHRQKLLEFIRHKHKTKRLDVFNRDYNKETLIPIANCEDTLLTDENGNVVNLKFKYLEYFLNNLLVRYENKSDEIEIRLGVIEELLENLILYTLNKKRTETNGKNKGGVVGKKLRQEILCRDNYTCKNCGKKKNDDDYGDDIVKFHIDHIIPKSKGGTNDKSNLQTLCSSCNLLKREYLFNLKKSKGGK